jgi:malate dehydrogenase
MLSEHYGLGNWFMHTNALLYVNVQRPFKVALLGAAGGIGQPLGLLLKMNPAISHLALYDIVHTPGVAADISHCSTPAKVTGHLGPQSLRDALEGSSVVIIPAGVPRKPG